MTQIQKDYSFGMLESMSHHATLYRTFFFVEAVLLVLKALVNPDQRSHSQNVSLLRSAAAPCWKRLVKMQMTWVSFAGCRSSSTMLRQLEEAPKELQVVLTAAKGV